MGLVERQINQLSLMEQRIFLNQSGYCGLDISVVLAKMERNVIRINPIKEKDLYARNGRSFR